MTTSSSLWLGALGLRERLSFIGIRHKHKHTHKVPFNRPLSLILSFFSYTFTHGHTHIKISCLLNGEKNRHLLPQQVVKILSFIPQKIKKIKKFFKNTKDFEHEERREWDNKVNNVKFDIMPYLFIMITVTTNSWL